MASVNTQLTKKSLGNSLQISQGNQLSSACDSASPVLLSPSPPLSANPDGPRRRKEARSLASPRAVVVLASQGGGRGSLVARASPHTHLWSPPRRRCHSRVILLLKYPEERACFLFFLLLSPYSFAVARGIHPSDRPTGRHGGKPVEEQPAGRERPRAVRPLALLPAPVVGGAAAVRRLLRPGPERGLLRRAGAAAGRRRRVRRALRGTGVPGPGAAARQAAAARPAVLADCRRLQLGGSGTRAIVFFFVLGNRRSRQLRLHVFLDLGRPLNFCSVVPQPTTN